MEYSDSETPIITTRKQGQRPHSIAGHPTTPGDKDELWWDEDFEDIPLTSTEPDSADAYIEDILSDTREDEFHDSQEHREFIVDGQFEDIDGYHGRIKVKDQVSQGDTDEWEDCETEEYWGSQVSSDSTGLGSKRTKSPNINHSLSPEDALRLNVALAQKNLNPDAPEFTPTSPLSPLSPEMMKTPEGHVKVGNWAEEMKTPTSGEKNLSFKSASPDSKEVSPSSPKGTTKGTSGGFPRKIEKDFVSPDKKDEIQDQRSSNIEDSRMTGKNEKECEKETISSQEEKNTKDSSESDSHGVDRKDCSPDRKHTTEKVESILSETAEEKSSVAESVANDGGVTAENADENKMQMAKPEQDSGSSNGSSGEVQDVAQDSTENLASNNEGPEGDKKVPEVGKKFQLFLII